MDSFFSGVQLHFTIDLIFAMMLEGCSHTEVEEEGKQNESETSMFIVVEEAISWEIAYHRETKVMYAISYGGYNAGTFTLLVDADGNPMLWEG